MTSLAGARKQPGRTGPVDAGPSPSMHPLRDRAPWLLRRDEKAAGQHRWLWDRCTWAGAQQLPTEEIVGSVPFAASEGSYSSRAPSTAAHTCELGHLRHPRTCSSAPNG